MKDSRTPKGLPKQNGHANRVQLHVCAIQTYGEDTTVGRAEKR